MLLDISNKILYRILIILADNRFNIFLNTRSFCIKRITRTPSRYKINVFSGCFFEGLNGLKLNGNISFNQDCFISAFGGLVIGNDVSIGHRVSILTTEHEFLDINVPIRNQPVSSHPVTIGNNVWIGANVTILAGVEISDGIIIGAGSIVTKSLLIENGIYVGNPAKFIKSRFKNN